MNVGLQKTSLVNYPRRLAAAVFLPGCNLRCPYCYNAELVCASVLHGPVIRASAGCNNDYVPVEAVFEHIEKRKSVLQGLVISGGEALLSPVVPELIVRAKKAGLAVKLDTNGLLPDALQALLGDRELCPDMVALDIKTNPSRYGELLSARQDGSPADGLYAETALKKTLKLLQTPESSAHSVEIEYRTVFVPPLVQAADIQAIADLLQPGAHWFFAPFLPGQCLNPAWNKIRPYTMEEMKQLIQLAQTKIPHSTLR